MTYAKEKSLKRSEQITKDYFTFLDQHIEDVINGYSLDFMELNQIAATLFISHSHLSDTIKQTMGQHPCHYYDLKIIDKAKLLLIESDFSIAKIAEKLTYNPSNFSKFFKKFTGQTAGEFRRQNKNSP